MVEARPLRVSQSRFRVVDRAEKVLDEKASATVAL
jgi:hypothetical protein